MADYDAVTIGTGQAGPALVRRLSLRAGKSRSSSANFSASLHQYWLHTKTLIASGYAAHLTRRAAEFGVNLSGTPSVDMKAVKARKDAVTVASRAAVERSLKGLQRVHEDSRRSGDQRDLGASLLGLSGDEVIHCIRDTMYAKAPSTVLQQAMHIHPTVSEFVPTMPDDLAPLQ